MGQLEILNDTGSYFAINLVTFLALTKVIYLKYSKNWPYTVAHTINCVCSKMLNHALNHGLFLSLFTLIPCPIHWIVQCELSMMSWVDPHHYNIESIHTLLLLSRSILSKGCGSTQYYNAVDRLKTSLTVHTGAKYLVPWSSRSLKMRELSFSQFWVKWFIFQIFEW